MTQERQTGRMARVPDERAVGEHGLVLRWWRRGDADQALAAVERSLPELRRWMPWAVDAPTIESVSAFHERAGAEAGSDTDMGYGVFEADGDLVSGGYWIGSDRTGCGDAVPDVQIRPPGRPPA